MGMISEKRTIQILEQRAWCTECVVENCSCAECDKAFSMAIDTMRKYQQIKQILKDIPYGGDATVRRIQEVIDDRTK